MIDASPDRGALHGRRVRSRSTAGEPCRTDAERAAFQSVRFAKDAVERSIVDGTLQPGQTTRHVRDEQVENFSNHVVAKCPELG